MLPHTELIPNALICTNLAMSIPQPAIAARAIAALSAFASSHAKCAGAPHPVSGLRDS
jgi:hypothetical protein